jgi:hypothetical protein
MKIYISGPISGQPDFNTKAFKNAFEFIFKECELLPTFEVINPLDIADWVINHFKEVGIKSPPMWEDFMRQDIKALVEVSCVYFLPGWEKSRGATIEHFIAQSLGIPCIKSKAALKAFIKNLEEI